MTVKLLEKEVFDKQDGILTLREQLDNVKAINHDLYNRLQVIKLLLLLYKLIKTWSDFDVSFSILLTKFTKV